MFKPTAQLAIPALLLWAGSAVAQEIFQDSFEVPIVDPDDGQCSVEIDGPTLDVETVWQNTERFCDYLIKRAGGPNAAVLQIDGVGLTIEPGVVIRLEQGVKISVLAGGSIHAVGQPSRRIRFEGAEATAGFANGIFFAGGSLASRLEYVDFAYLGRAGVLTGDPDGAIDGSTTAAGVTLRRSTVSGSADDGADFEQLQLSDFFINRFFANNGHALRIGADQMHLLDRDSDYLGGAQLNTRPSVRVDGVSQPATELTVWPNLNAPYFVPVALNIEFGGDVTIEPGAHFLLDQGASIGVRDGGILRALGTAAAPIVFEGEQATAGYWDSIRLFEAGSTANRIQHAIIRHGGGGFIFEGNISVGSDSTLTVRDSVISDSANFGVCVSSFATSVDIDASNTFSNNPDGDIGSDC